MARIGAQALADTPGTKFHRKAQLRFAAREAFARSSNDAALRRAELRKVRPSRGPFPIGTYVFYFDAAAKEPGPNCWRGVARVVGKEGSRTSGFRIVASFWLFRPSTWHLLTTVRFSSGFPFRTKWS